jgi:hypothetical protein
MTASDHRMAVPKPPYDVVLDETSRLGRYIMSDGYSIG